MVAKFLVDNRNRSARNEVAMMRLRAVAEQTNRASGAGPRPWSGRRNRVRAARRAAQTSIIYLSLESSFARSPIWSIARFPVCSDLAPRQPHDRISWPPIILVGGSTKIR